MARNIFSCVALIVLYSVGFLSAPSNAAKILAFYPTPSKSHLLIHCAVADTLAKSGHNVTVIASSNVYKNAKYNFIQIGNAPFNVNMLTNVINKPQPLYQRFGTFLSEISTSANKTFMDPIMQQFLRDNGEGSFDLLILGYFMNDFHLGLGGHFKCPIVVSFMLQTMAFTNDMVGNPAEQSYVPSLFSGLKQPLTFWERVANFIANLFETYVISGIKEYYAQKGYKFHFPAHRYPSLDDVRKNISLVFVNHHFSQGPIRPNVPSLVEIGGIQIKEKPDPLPADIAEVLDNSKKGVIYFSLGSNVQSGHLKKEKIEIIFKVLSHLPYTVLWKWSDSELPGTSSNIIYKSWLPQDDILAHPNVKLFITHGGQGSVVESQYHGVPMVAMPLFGDQPINAKNMERSGYGVTVDYITMTEENFKNAILNVLENPEYAKTVKAFSKLYRDRAMTPRQLVNFWVDYVLRHNGAKFLQSPVVHMNFWQRMSLDVIGFLTVIIVIVLIVLGNVCKMLCCKRRKHVRNSKKIN